MELSTLIGKPVLSPAGETLGYVKGAYVAKNMNAVSSLVCVDGEEEEFYLPVRAVLSAEDAVIAGNARLKEPTGTNFPLGAPVYTSRGEYLGTATELTLCADIAALSVTKNKRTVRFSANRLAFQDAVIVYPERAKRPLTPRGKSAENNAEPQTEHAVRPPIAESGERKHAQPPENAQREQEKPYANNLLGKRLKRALTDSDGKELVAEGEAITPGVVRLAAQNNRLLELSANTFHE